MMSLMQVNLVMWATQPVLTAALNKEYRTKKTPGCDDDVYPQIAVRRRVCMLALLCGFQPARLAMCNAVSGTHIHSWSCEAHRSQTKSCSTSLVVI